MGADWKGGGWDSKRLLVCDSVRGHAEAGLKNLGRVALGGLAAIESFKIAPAVENVGDPDAITRNCVGDDGRGFERNGSQVRKKIIARASAKRDIADTQATGVNAAREASRCRDAAAYGKNIFEDCEKIGVRRGAKPNL